MLSVTLFFARDGTNSDCHQRGERFTSFVVVLAVPISRESGDIGLDLALVPGVVPSEGSGQFGRFIKDLGPRFNDSDVFSHFVDVAGFEGLGNLLDYQAELSGGLDVISQPPC